MSGPNHDEPADPSGFYIVGPDGAPEMSLDGPPGPPGRRPVAARRRAAVLVVAALLIFGLGVAVGDHRGSNSATTSADLSSSRAPVSTTGDATSPTGSSATTSRTTRSTRSTAGSSAPIAWLTGTPLPTGTHIDARVYLAQQASGLTRVVLYDLDTRQISPIRGLPEVPGWMSVVPISGGVAVAGPPPGQSSGGPAVLYIVRGDRVVRHFPASGQTFPADDGVSLWQASQPESGPGWVEKIDLTGKRLTPRYPLSAGRTPIRGTPAGLLTSAADSSDRAQLWDPATGKVSHTFGRLIAADASRLAWTDTTCRSAGCALHVSDLTTDTTTFVNLPHPETVTASFSQAHNPPRLAVAVTEPGRIGNATTVQHVYEFDLSSGARYRMPGVQLPPGADLDLAWSPDGRWLFITATQAGTQSYALAAWNLGAPNLDIIATDLPTVTIAAITGPN